MFKGSSRKALTPGLKCKVQLLVPGEFLDVDYTIDCKGRDIWDRVVKELDLLDKDYYGLKFHDQIQWLDLSKSVTKQTKGLNEVAFVLRFKYYPAEPALLSNESTRYYLYLQLRADLIEGRLRADSQETIAYLIACVLQSELGDATGLSERQDNYVSEYKFVPNQTEDLEWAAIRLHQSEDFLGLRPADAELNFLKKAVQLDTYGIDPFPVKDNSQSHYLIGVNYKGISLLRDSKQITLYSWDDIEQISSDSKHMLLYYRKLNKKGKQKTALIGFRCPSYTYAINLWKLAHEHKYFFTFETTPKDTLVAVSGGLFRRYNLKCVGRVEKDVLRDRIDDARSVGVKRSRSLMAKTHDGPLWQGFQQYSNNDLQTSLHNLDSHEYINKTLPPNMNYFKEEEEENSNNTEEPINQRAKSARKSSDAGAKPSLGSPPKDSPKPFSRKPNLITKASADGHTVRRGSQVYMDLDQPNRDFIRATIFLGVLFVVLVISIVLVSDPDRPNSVSLLVKRLHLEPVLVPLRQHYYVPIKTSLRQGLERVFSILDAKLI